MKPPSNRSRDRRPGGPATPAGPRGPRGPRDDSTPRPPREEQPPREERTGRPPLGKLMPAKTRSGHPGQWTPKRKPDANRNAPRPERPAREEREDRPAPSPTTLRAPMRDAVRDAAAEPVRESRRGEAGPKPAPGGAVWLYGIHAVAAALANPARLLRRVILTEEAEAEVSSRLRGPLPMAVERVDRARLEQLLGRGVIHQGAALLTDPLPQLGLQQALARPGPVLVLDQVSDPRNVGAIMRSAAAFGAAAVIAQDRNAPEESGAMAKAASGAMERLPLIRAVNIARTLIALRAAGLWVVGLDAGGTPLRGAAFAERRVALVLGNEGEGLRRLTRETCDEIASIAMPGSGDGLDSLNVSAAATVALYELVGRN